MAYVDGFVIAVPRKKMKAYEKMAREGKKILRAHRDRVNAKIMQMMKETSQPADMPFAMKRMAYGGFRVIVSS